MKCRFNVCIHYSVMKTFRNTLYACCRSLSTTSSEYGRTRRESGSSQEGVNTGGSGSGGYSLGRRDRKSSSSSGKGIRTGMKKCCPVNRLNQSVNGCQSIFYLL